MMRKVVLVLGTFNPITNAHLELGIQAASLIPDADVYYVPSNLKFMHKWKSVENFLTDGDRLILTNNVVKEYCFYVSDIELIGYLDGKTYNTVEYFRKELCYNEVYICCGYDKLKELQKWYKAEELLEENKFLLFARYNKKLKDCDCPFIEKYSDSFIEVKLEDRTQDISSTVVRKAFKENKLEEIKGIVPELVYDYLVEKRKNNGI